MKQFPGRAEPSLLGPWDLAEGVAASPSAPTPGVLGNISRCRGQAGGRARGPVGMRRRSQRAFNPPLSRAASPRRGRGGCKAALTARNLSLCAGKAPSRQLSAARPAGCRPLGWGRAGVRGRRGPAAGQDPAPALSIPPRHRDDAGLALAWPTQGAQSRPSCQALGCQAELGGGGCRCPQGLPGSHFSSHRGLWGRAHAVMPGAWAVPPGPFSAAPCRHANCPILPAAGHPLAPGTSS